MDAPPKRRVWDEARTADAAWARALAAHRASIPGSPGLPDRLHDSARAARALADVARHAHTAGLAWAPVGGDTPDALPGELAPHERWLCSEWVDVERADRHAVQTVRSGSLPQLADALDVLGDALDALAAVADEPHGPPVGPRPN